MSSESTCNEKGCNEDWVIFLTPVIAGQAVNAKRFCIEHARNLLNLYASGHFIPGGQSQAIQGLIRCELTLLAFDDSNQAAQIYLQEVGGSRVLIIPTGYDQATMLYNAVKRESNPRPMTHQSMVTIIGTLGARIIDVSISRFDEQGQFYYAELRMSQQRHVITADMRPSDALGIVLYSAAPLFIAETLLRSF